MAMYNPVERTLTSSDGRVYYFYTGLEIQDKASRLVSKLLDKGFTPTPEYNLTELYLDIKAVEKERL